MPATSQLRQPPPTIFAGAVATGGLVDARPPREVDQQVHGGLVSNAEGCADPNNPACTNGGGSDVLGWKDAREIPNYWNYAKNFVLQDHMFEPNASWSLPEHLYMVSEWSALCSKSGDPMSCANALQSPARPDGSGKSTEKAKAKAKAKAAAPTTAALNVAAPTTTTDAEGDPVAPVPGSDYAWTDLTYLMHKANVPWGYYVVAGTEPDCQNDAAVSCAPVKQDATTPGIWNPLPNFDTVKQDGQEANIQSVENFYTQAKAGSLPAVSWVVPSGALGGQRLDPIPRPGQCRPGDLMGQTGRRAE